MIANFNYYTPTEVAFGRGAENQVGLLAKKYGATKVLLHFGGQSAKKSGLYDKVADALTAQGIAFVPFGGVVPNPRLSLVYEGIELCKKEGVDFILAVGGGSVIDSAKAIGYGVANDGDVWDFYDFKRKAAACLPVATVLTIAAAGSEMSNSSVITKDEGLLKRGYSSDLGRPCFSILNPELTMTLPAYQTACGCVDIMMHTMERYFNQQDNMELTDGISEALLKTVMHNALILVKDPANYNARAEIMWAGSLAHNGLTGCGTEGGDWATHNLEMELSGMFDVAHGAGLAAVWASWARYVCDHAIHRFKRFAINVMGERDTGDDRQTAQNGIAAMEAFYRAIEMPTTLRELGIAPTDAEIDELAEKCAVASGGAAGAVMPLYASDMVKIYKAAY